MTPVAASAFRQRPRAGCLSVSLCCCPLHYLQVRAISKPHRPPESLPLRVVGEEEDIAFLDAGVAEPPKAQSHEFSADAFPACRDYPAIRRERKDSTESASVASPESLPSRGVNDHGVESIGATSKARVSAGAARTGFAGWFWSGWVRALLGGRREACQEDCLRGGGAVGEEDEGLVVLCKARTSMGAGLADLNVTFNREESGVLNFPAGNRRGWYPWRR